MILPSNYIIESNNSIIHRIRIAELWSLPVVKPRFANLAEISANPPTTTPHSVRMHSGQGGEVQRPNTSCFKIGRL